MLKQLIPAEFCLKCDVCCRFLDKNSPYAANFLPEEIKTLKKIKACDTKCFKQISEDAACQISLVPYKNILACPFFLPQSNACAIYHKRPLDCRLYPFLITYDKEYKNVMLCIDTKCPYANQIKNINRRHPYVKYLAQVLKRRNLPHSFIMPYQPDAIALAPLEGLSNSIYKPSPCAQGLGGFKKLALQDKNIFDEYLIPYAEWGHSARSFINIYAWSDLFNILWKFIDGNLCIFYEYKNEFNMMLPPLSKNGKPSKKAVLECVKMLKAGGRIENIAAEETQNLKDCGIKIHKNTDEYIYLRKELAELGGNKFASHRAAANQFAKRHKYIYRPFDITDMDECLDLYINWAGQRKRKNPDAVYRQLLQDSFTSHKRAMTDYKKLGFTARVVEVDGKISAYTFAFKLNEETYCAAIEVADLSIKGLAQFMYQRLAQDLRDAVYINAMDDSGLENLKKTKLAWRPCRVLSNYIGVVD